MLAASVVEKGKKSESSISEFSVHSLLQRDGVTLLLRYSPIQFEQASEILTIRLILSCRYSVIRVIFLSVTLLMFLFRPTFWPQSNWFSDDCRWDTIMHVELKFLFGRWIFLCGLRPDHWRDQASKIYHDSKSKRCWRHSKWAWWRKTCGIITEDCFGQSHVALRSICSASRSRQIGVHCSWLLRKNCKLCL